MSCSDIPYFSEIILMAATCDRCGFRTTEVKSGGPIGAKGRRIELKITDSEDVTRDILKVRRLLCGSSDRTRLVLMRGPRHAVSGVGPPLGSRTAAAS